MKHASNHRRYTTQTHTQKMADYESAAAAVVKSFCLYWRASGSMRPFVHLCVLCVPWRRWTDSPSLSLSLCLQKDHTEPWYRRTQWGGSSAWLTRHSRNRKRDYLPEGLFGCVCMCVLTWVCECMHVCVHVCVYDIAFQLGTHSSLCHQGH